MARRGFIPAKVDPIPADKRHPYEHDPETRRCTRCPLPESNKRVHRPSDRKRAEWSRFDDALLGERVS